MIAANPLLQITAKAGVTSYATARSVALITRVRHRAAAALTDTARTAARWPVRHLNADSVFLLNVAVRVQQHISLQAK